MSKRLIVKDGKIWASGPKGLYDPEERHWAETLKHEDTTCWEYPRNADCKYAWDAYNTGGDCLADK